MVAEVDTRPNRVTCDVWIRRGEGVGGIFRREDQKRRVHRVERAAEQQLASPRRRRSELEMSLADGRPPRGHVSHIRVSLVRQARVSLTTRTCKSTYEDV